SIASIIVAPIMTVFFPMLNNSAGAGMGTSGLVGQIMAIETMGPNMTTYILITVFHLILPGVVTYAFYKVLFNARLIKPGDQVLNLGNEYRSNVMNVTELKDKVLKKLDDTELEYDSRFNRKEERLRIERKDNFKGVDIELNKLLQK